MLILKQKIAKFLETNLDQPLQQWDAVVEYAVKTRVVYKNYIYMTIVDKNKGVQPDLNTGKWLLFGVDNSYAAIDLQSHTISKMDDGLSFMQFKFDATGFDYLGFGAVQGSELIITEYASNGTVIKTTNHKIGTDRTCAVDWYNYYYCPIPDQQDLGKGKPIDYLHGNLDGNVSSIEVKILKNSDNVASLGSMVGGKSIDIGETQFGVEMGLIDYSRKETDEYGITTIKKRESRETMTSEVVMAAKHTQLVKRAVKEVLGEVVMFIANPDTDSQYEHLIQLGYIDEFNIYINNGVISRAKLYTLEVI